MRVQADHWAVILDFCEQNPEIITNKLIGPKGKENLQHKWAELTVLLNSLGLGEKSTEEWKKSIIDWKSKTKTKAVAVSKYVGGTGGGPPCVPLKSFEEKLLNIMGIVAIEGDKGVREVGIKRPSETRQVFPTQPKIQKTTFLTVKKDQCQPYPEESTNSGQFSSTHQRNAQNKILILGDQILNKEIITVPKSKSHGKSTGTLSNLPQTSVPTQTLNIPGIQKMHVMNAQLDETYTFPTETSHSVENPGPQFHDQLQSQVLGQVPLLHQESVSTSFNIRFPSVATPSPNTTCIPKNYPLCTNNIKENVMGSSPSDELGNSVPHRNEMLRKQGPTLQQTSSTRRRESSTQLSQQLQTMNDGVLQVLHSINTNISKIAVHLSDLVEVVRDLKQ